MEATNQNTSVTLASSAGNSIGAFSGQNKRADMLSDGNGV